MTILLKAGCDPGVVDDEGFTPADYAACNGIWVVWKAALLASGQEDLVKRWSAKPKSAGGGIGKELIWCYYCENFSFLCAEVDRKLHSSHPHEVENSDSESEGYESDECESQASTWAEAENQSGRFI